MPRPLSERAVGAILALTEESNLILVGGQCLSFLARYYAAARPEIRDIYSMSSEDIDFLGTVKQAQNLASQLADGVTRSPAPDDATVSAAVVQGTIYGEPVIIDFMRNISGVDRSEMAQRKLVFSMEKDGSTMKVLCMHPIDCVKSRLSNINTLHRTDSHSISSAKASIIILECFIDEALEAGNLRAAQDALKSIEYVSRSHCQKKSYLHFDLDPHSIREKYLKDDRLDLRWRVNILDKSISRARRRCKIARQMLRRSPLQSTR